jgi:hypothetical protein
MKDSPLPPPRKIIAAGLPVTAGIVSIGTLIAFTILKISLFRPITGLLSTGIWVISSLAPARPRSTT